MRGLVQIGPAAILVITLFTSTPVMADKYDLKLDRLWEVDPQTGNVVMRGEDFFKNLMGDLGSALAPRFLGPAATLGSLGFQIAVDFSMTNIPENSERWKTVMTDWTGGASQQEGADNFLNAIQVHVRKGLPFSTEVGGTFSKLLRSNMWGVGLEFKITPLEGFASFPEVALRGNVGTYLGARDFSLLTAGFDFIISKKLGIAGLFKLAPYVGFNLLYTHAASNVILVYDKYNPDKQPQQEVFSPIDDFRPNAVFGFQLTAVVFNTGFEATVGDKVETYSVRIGVDF